MRPEPITLAHPELEPLAEPVADQVKRLRDEGERLLRKHGKGIVDQGMAHKRYADALVRRLAQIAVLSRVTAIFEEQGVEASRAGALHRRDVLHARRAPGRTSELDQLERNDDDRMHSIARLAYKRGEYGYALFED